MPKLSESLGGCYFARANELAKEEHAWRSEFEARADAHPELIPRLLLRVEGVGADA